MTDGGISAVATISDTPLTINSIVIIAAMVGGFFSTYFFLEKKIKTEISDKTKPIVRDIADIKVQYVTCKFCEATHSGLERRLDSIEAGQAAMHEDIKEILKKVGV